MSTFLEQASLVLIPSGYKEDTVYSVIPSNGSGDMSFTRASDGTRINSDGLVENTPYNLLSYSEDLSNAVWGKINVTINSNTTVAPNGTTTADTLTNSSTGYGIFATISVIPNQAYTFSFYIKKGSNTSYILNVIDASTNANITLLNYSSQISATDWVRITSTFTIPSITTSIRVYQMRDGASLGTAFLWGAQLNIGSTAKPYFPTTDRLNVPRLTYQNGGGGCPSLLLEPQRTNLMTFSESFDNAAWTKSGATITANVAVSPDGFTNADLQTGGEIYQQKTQPHATDCTMSVFVKKDTAASANIRYIDKSGTFVGGGMIYTYATNAITINQSANASVTAEVINYGNGWYRLILKYVAAASVTFNYQGIQASGSFIYGAQFEASAAYATSYIPTLGAAVTRLADACSKTGISSLIGQTSGTLFVQCNLQDSTGLGQTIATLYENSSNVIILYKQSDNVLKCFVLTGGTLVADLGLISVSGNIKIAVGYNANDFALYINGVQRGTDTSGSVPTCSNLYLGADDGGAQKMSGIISQAILFKTRLTNAELAQLTL